MRFMRPILLLITGFFITTVAAAQTGSHSVYVADPRTNIHRLQEVTTVLFDSLNKHTPEEVTSGSLDKLFTPAMEYQNPMHARKTYWIRVRIAATSAFNGWQLMLVSSNRPSHDYAQHEEADFFQLLNGHVISRSKGGTYTPASERSIKAVPAINRVLFSMAPGDTQTIYVRIYNQWGKYAPLPTIELRSSEMPVPSPAISTDLTVASTTMLTLSVLSLVFFFFVRDKAYLFFSGYTLFLGLHYHVLNPTVPLISMFMPEHPHFISYLWRILTMGSFIFFLLFSRSFIPLSRLSKKTDTLLKWFIVFWGIVALAGLGTMYFSGNDFLDTGIFFVLFAGMLAFVIRIAFFKNVLARIFVTGALWLTVFTILGGLWSDGMPFPVNPWLTGQMGQLLIYCIGLAYKIRLNEKAKAEADHIKELDEIKSKFFANISHEFRTPLTLIRGPLQQIEEQSSNNAGDTTVNVPRNKIRVMRRHTDRLLELVNQLLDLFPPGLRQNETAGG